MVRKRTTNPTWSVRSNANILYGDGQRIVLEKKIWSHFALGDRVIICFVGIDYDADDPRMAQNIVCIDRNGIEKWRIEPAKGTEYSGKHGQDVPVSYAGVRIERPSGIVKCSVPPGVEFDLDIDAGTVSNPVYER